MVRRILVKAFLAVVMLLLISALGGYIYLRQSLPATDGQIELVGISAPVEIVRDADAIPHIFGATKLDALFGLGFVHAQDRLWQMEFQRRIGFGRLSEIFGTPTIPDDRFLRTVGFGRAARAAWDNLPENARRQVDAYVAGINAFIATHSGRLLPPEFTLLRFDPQPWTGPDVIVWAKMMAWDLSENYRFELMRRDLAARVGVERMAELLPPYPVDGLSVVDNGGTPTRDSGTPERDAPQTSGSGTPNRGAPQDSSAMRHPSSWSDAFARSFAAGHPLVYNFLAGTKAEARGSNNWVVDGTLTASGKPLLANDPHLAAHIPSIWYLAHMNAGEFDVIGATLPGLPAVAIGRNRFIAWGETNVGADVQDLYLEKLDATGSAAEFKGEYEPLRTATETILVKGGEPVTVTVRSTRHGPLVSDAINANNRGGRAAEVPPMALRWTALDDDDRTLAAFLQVNEAKNWREFTAALRDFVVPAQNFVYADVDGHIGYYAPARIPIRSNGDGSMPVEGWTGSAEWQGWIPFDELPHTVDPSGHFIVTANNRPMPADYRHFVALEYPIPYRAQRITDLIRGKNGLKADDFRAFQSDTRSLHAESVLPLLLKHARPSEAIDRQAIEVLRAWDFDMRGDSAAAAMYQAWFFQLEPAFAGDELGDANTIYDGRFSYITRFVTNTLNGAHSQWCDDERSEGLESCEEAVTKALHDGVAMLVDRLGGDMTRWRWAEAHRAIFPHQGLDAVGFLRPLLSRSVPNQGDFATVNVGAVDVDHPFDQVAIPGYRQIVDLSTANDSRFIDAVGQSGHFLSPHYDDFLQDWHDVRHRPMRMDRNDIDRGAVGRLKLVPK